MSSLHTMRTRWIVIVKNGVKLEKEGELKKGTITKGESGVWRPAGAGVLRLSCWQDRASGLEDLQSCCLDASPVQTPLVVSSFLQSGLLAPRATCVPSSHSLKAL